MTAAVKLSNTF